MLNPCLQSLSKWNPLLFYQPHAHHGEKLQPLSPLMQTSQLDLLDLESSVLHCVDPHDVNPITGIELTVPQKENFVGETDKLGMEEFGDIAPLLHKSANVMLSATDELNTPVFDKKGPFNFMVSQNNIESPQVTDPFKFGFDINHTGNSVKSTRQLNDLSVYSNMSVVQIQECNNSELVHIVQGSGTNIIFTTSEAEQEGIYVINGNETPIHVQQQDLSASSTNIEETHSVLSVNSTEHLYSNVSSPDIEYSVNTPSIHNENASPRRLGIYTPEDSNSSIVETKKVTKLNLKLECPQAFILNTPDVIDSVVDLEESNFNIFDYLQSKDQALTVNIDDFNFEEPQAATKPLSKRVRKRRSDYDDEDYEPPSSKLVKLEELSESESDSETITVAKRGRPSRRTSSVSSEHSGPSKYRELRDKNNEASRKSRLKRKNKEQSLQKEADELEEKNVKLTAQVAEYEKMVNTFRNNLFKLMLKK